MTSREKEIMFVEYTRVFFGIPENVLFSTYDAHLLVALGELLYFPNPKAPNFSMES